MAGYCKDWINAIKILIARIFYNDLNETQKEHYRVLFNKHIPDENNLEGKKYIKKLNNNVDKKEDDKKKDEGNENVIKLCDSLGKYIEFRLNELNIPRK